MYIIIIPSIFLIYFFFSINIYIYIYNIMILDSKEFSFLFFNQSIDRLVVLRHTERVCMIIINILFKYYYVAICCYLYDIYIYIKKTEKYENLYVVLLTNKQTKKKKSGPFEHFERKVQ